MYRKCEKCTITSEELFKNRDEDGFIILEDKIPQFSNESREQVGNDDRIKNWIETADGKQFMIKTNAKLDGEENYTNYAELICEELANQMGIPYAKYDIIKIDGEEGIITENMLQKDEYMVSLEDFIWGSMENPEPTNKGIIDYPDVMSQLTKKLISMGYDKKQSKKLIKDFNKRMFFDCLVGATDRHAENVSVILNEKDKKAIKLSPVYDTENSLLLENTKEMVQQMSLDPNYCKEVALKIMPKMAIVPSDNATVEDITRATFEVSIAPSDDDYELEDYASEMIETIDMDKVFKNVEHKINSTLPFEVKRVAGSCVNYRRGDFSKMLDGSVFVDYDDKYIKNIQEKLNMMREDMKDKNAIGE